MLADVIRNNVTECLRYSQMVSCRNTGFYFCSQN